MTKIALSVLLSSAIAVGGVSVFATRSIANETSSECPTSQLKEPTTPSGNLAPPWHVDEWATYIWDLFWTPIPVC